MEPGTAYDGLHHLIASRRAELESARIGGSTALEAALAAIGVPPQQRTRAAALVEALPRFDDSSGNALNAAAARLMGGQTASGGGHALPIATLPGARLAEGLWKYVLLEVTDADGASRRVARNFANLAYHAEMARKAMGGELAAFSNVTVLGGGRIRFSVAKKRIEIYGYSKSYGRCRRCNQQAASRAEAAYPNYSVTWSNEGY